MICRNCNRNISNMDKICPYCNAVQVFLRDKEGNIIEPEKETLKTETESVQSEADVEDESNKIKQKERDRRKKRGIHWFPLVIGVFLAIAVWNIMKGRNGGRSSSDSTLAVSPSEMESSIHSQEIEQNQKEEERWKDTTVEETQDLEVEEPQKTEHWLSVEGVQPEYLFWDSDNRYLTPDDMKYDTAQELRLVRNEIFARRGRIFQDESIAAYFSSKPWYKGTIVPDRFDYDKLNSFEKANVSLIQELEKTAKTLLWVQHDGEWFGYDQFGIPMSGWIRNNGLYYFLENDGRMVTGYQGDEPMHEDQILKGNGYFFLADGSLYYGTVWCRGSGDEGVVLYEDDLTSAGLDAFMECEEVTFYEDGSYLGRLVQR